MGKLAAGVAALVLALLMVFGLNGASAAADESDAFVMPNNGIPVLILNIDESQGTIDGTQMRDRITA